MATITEQVKGPAHWLEVEQALRPFVSMFGVQRVLEAAGYWAAQAYPSQAAQIKAANNDTIREALVDAFNAGRERGRQDMAHNGGAQ